MWKKKPHPRKLVLAPAVGITLHGHESLTLNFYFFTWSFTQNSFICKILVGFLTGIVGFNNHGVMTPSGCCNSSQPSEATAGLPCPQPRLLPPLLRCDYITARLWACWSGRAGAGGAVSMMCPSLAASARAGGGGTYREHITIAP